MATRQVRQAPWVCAALMREGQVSAQQQGRARKVLADEPTGNLDTASSDEVFALMRRMHAELGTSFLVVTHSPRLAERCDRVIELVDGLIKRDQVTAVARSAR